MMIDIILVIIVLVAIIIYKRTRFKNIEVNGDQYQLEKNSPGPEQSLNRLINIRKKLKQLIQHMLDQNPSDIKAQRMKKRFSDTILRESNPDGDPTETSYTINKGDVMVICLRTNDGQLVDINTLMYVAIHELAHIYSSNYHHGPEFWKNMSILIKEATKVRIYQRINYSENPVRYCGIKISSNIPDKIYNQSGSGIKTNPILDFILARSYINFGYFNFI